MQSRDWFGVGVRLLPVWELTRAAGYLIAWIYLVKGLKEGVSECLVQAQKIAHAPNGT